MKKISRQWLERKNLRNKIKCIRLECWGFTPSSPVWSTNKKAGFLPVFFFVRPDRLEPAFGTK